jgi:hypothetical protein
MDNKRMENKLEVVLFKIESQLQIKYNFSGKQKNGKQKWKTTQNNTTYLQVK